MLLRTVLGVVALFASLVLLVMGNAMLGTIAALRLKIDRYDPEVIGLVLALTALGFVLGSVHAIRIVARVGHIRAFAVFAALAAAAALAHPLHVSVPVWMVLRLVLGFCIAGLMLVAESWVNGHATAQTRGALLATYMVLSLLAASSGQFLVALGDPHYLFVLAGILIILSLVPVSLTLAAPPPLERTERLGLRALWRRSELGVAAAAVSGVMLGAFGTVGPVYAYQMGLGVEEVGVFMGLAMLAAIALQWPMNYLSDYLPRRVVIVGVAGAALAAALAVAAFGHGSTLYAYTSVAAFYSLASCIYPLALALTHDVLPRAQIVPASAALLLANGIGAVAGPVIGGISIGVLGPAGLFLFLAAALGVLVLLALHSFVRERAPKVREQTHAVGVAPVSTEAILHLDPRQTEERAPSAAA